MSNTRTVRRGKRNCPHYETVAIRIATIATVNGGLERIVCEICGYATIRSLDDLSSLEATTTNSHPIRPANARQTTCV